MQFQLFLPKVIRTMKKICTPDPTNAVSSHALLGGLNTSPWTSFQPVSSIVSSCDIDKSNIKIMIPVVPKRHFKLFHKLLLIGNLLSPTCLILGNLCHTVGDLDVTMNSIV